MKRKLVATAAVVSLIIGLLGGCQKMSQSIRRKMESGSRRLKPLKRKTAVPQGRKATRNMMI